MAKVTKHRGFEEFIKYNQNFIETNAIEISNVIGVLERAEFENTFFNWALNIEDKTGANIFCLILDDYRVMLHGKKWNKNIIQTFNNLDIIKHFKKGMFSGNKDLVIEILDSNKLLYDKKKDRLVYRCEAIIQNQTLSDGEFELATISDHNRISDLAYLFGLNEYGPTEATTRDYFSRIIKNAIDAQSICKWTVNGKITSILQIASSVNGYPTITLFYTDEKHRNKGYGKSLLTEATKLVLTRYDKVGLTSDVTCEYSNKTFISVGYKAVYKFITIVGK